jgi:hypothetical protein
MISAWTWRPDMRRRSGFEVEACRLDDRLVDA